MRKIIIAVVFILGTLGAMGILGCTRATPTSPGETTEYGEELLADQGTGPTTEKEPFNITLLGMEYLPLAAYQKRYIVEAKEIVEGIIVEGLPEVRIHASIREEPIDDLAVYIVMGQKENALAAASNILNRNNNGLPYWGVLTIHKGLIDRNYSSSDWRQVIVHELIHILGFVEPTIQGNLTEKINGVRFFNGENAILGYRDILYNVMGEKTAFAIPDLRVPMAEHEHGTHWKYPEMKWEIMQRHFFRNASLTKVTLGALSDIGYKVDMTKAETPSRYYTKPAIAGPHFACDGQHIRVTNGGAP